ncbi:unnamed protein product, partial [marine sediment metagenome]
GVGTQEAKPRRGQKPSQARLFAFELWQQNPLITLAELGQALQDKSFQTTRPTY